MATSSTKTVRGELLIKIEETLGEPEKLFLATFRIPTSGENRLTMYLIDDTMAVL